MVKSAAYMRKYRARKKLQAQQAQQAQTVVEMPVQQQVASSLPGATHTLAEVQAMTSDEFADYMRQLNNDPNPIPAVLHDSALQRMVYDTGLNDKPEIVSESKLRTMQGPTLWRGIDAVYDHTNDVNHPADQIARQTLNSSYSRVGGGTSAGDGFYFADSRGSSYGSTRGDVTRTAVIHGKLNSNARVIDERRLLNMFSNEPASLQQQLAVPHRDPHQQSSSNNLSAYALYRGYNVIKVSFGGYYNVIDRSAVTFSSRIEAR